MTDGIGRVAAIAAEQDGVVTAAQCLAAGVSRDEILQRCRAGQWRGVFRGVYHINGAIADVPLRARIRAALLTLGPASVATLTSAAHLHRLPYVPDDPAVHVGVPAALRRLDQPGLVVRQLVLADADCREVDGLRATTTPRTLADLVLRLHRFDMVAMLDGALFQKKITGEDLAMVAGLIRRRRGAVRARRWLAEADGRSASPLETRIRLICVDADLRPEEVQYPVLDGNGHLLAVGDLAWPSRRLIVEADGALVHSTPHAVYHDRRRQNELSARGWTVLRFTWADVARPGYVVTAIRRALTAGATAARAS
jgi:hypothetical protein